jgi:hypothetical protein
MCKASRVNCITIAHKFRDGFRESDELAHISFPYLPLPYCLFGDKPFKDAESSARF